MPLKRPMMRLPPIVLAIALTASAAGGCAGPDLETGAGTGMFCIDDSPHCINERRSALRHLVTDQDRTWVKQTAPPAAYASGVRLFAFRSKKKELSCDELAHARREADGAANVLRGPSGAQFTTAQVSRSVILAGEVSRELAAEQAKRCKT